VFLALLGLLYHALNFKQKTYNLYNFLSKVGVYLLALIYTYIHLKTDPKYITRYSVYRVVLMMTELSTLS